MAAYVAATVNEDGIIEPEVICTRMDPAEYASREAKIKHDKLFLHALEVLAEALPCSRCSAKPESLHCEEKKIEHSCELLIPGAEAMHDDPVVRVCSRPAEAQCDICGGDAHWKAESWMRSYPVYLCNDHQQSRQDQYKCFDRI